MAHRGARTLLRAFRMGEDTVPLRLPGGFLQVNPAGMEELRAPKTNWEPKRFQRRSHWRSLPASGRARDNSALREIVLFHHVAEAAVAEFEQLGGAGLGAAGAAQGRLQQALLDVGDVALQVDSVGGQRNAGGSWNG
jgi:hypothetical protein